MSVLFESNFENGFAGMATGADAGCLAEVQSLIVYEGAYAASFYINDIIKRASAAVTFNPVDMMRVEMAVYLVPPVNVYEKIYFLKLRDDAGNYVLTGYIQLLPSGYMVRVLNDLSGVMYNSEYTTLSEGWHAATLEVSNDSVTLTLGGVTASHQEVGMLPYAALMSVQIGNLWSDVAGGSMVIIDALKITYVGSEESTTLTVQAPETVTKGSQVNVSGKLTRTVDGVILPSRNIEASVNGSFVGSVLTDANGEYLIQLLFEEAGSYTVTAYYAGEAGLLSSQNSAGITVTDKPVFPTLPLAVVAVGGAVVLYSLSKK